MDDDTRKDETPKIERHEAYDRFGKSALRTAHDLSAALAEGGRPEGEEPVVLRTTGPHRSIDEVAGLIDAALADEAHAERGAAGHAPKGTAPDDHR